MRIAINALSSNVGGGRTYLVNLLRTLGGRLGRAHQFVVFLRPEFRSQLGAARPNFVFLQIPTRASRHLVFRLAWEQLALPVLLSRQRADVLYSPGNIGCWATPIPTVLAIRYTSVFDGILPERISIRKVKWGLQAAATRLSAPRARRIIVVSEWSRRRLSEVLGLSDERVRVIHHGLNPSFRRQAESTSKMVLAEHGIAQPYVLAVSNLMPHKNYPNLLRAFACLMAMDEVPGQLRLVVVGGGGDRHVTKEIQGIIQEEALEGRVCLLGQAEYSHLPALYSAAEAFVFPTRSSETFGFPLLEAMGSEVPIAASKTSAIPEICGSAALYFDPDRPEEMADCMREILTNAELASQLRRRGSERASLFSWDETVARTLAVLTEAANQR